MQIRVRFGRRTYFVMVSFAPFRMGWGSAGPGRDPYGNIISPWLAFVKLQKWAPHG